VSTANLTLAATTRAIVGQPLGRPAVRLVLRSPWINDQRWDSCVIDGTLARIGDRVLLTAQLDSVENGIYTLQFTRNGAGVMVGFFNTHGTGDNFRTRDGFSDGDVVFASSGLANKGLWIANIAGPWNPDHTPVYFSPAPAGFGAIQRLIRWHWRLASRVSSGFFGRAGTASGPGVRYVQLLAAASRAIASVFVAPPVRPPPPRPNPHA
jgi:hypothetical protein